MTLESEGAFVPAREMAVTLARAVLTVPDSLFERALEEGERALAVGPVLDPTLFQRGANPLEDQMAVIRAARDFRAALVEVRERITS